MANLTVKQIVSAKPAHKSYTLSDGKGMYLEISPKGGKWWRFRYQFNGKTKKVSLGTFPDVTLVDARKKRDSARSILANEGIDPFAKKIKPDANVTKELTFKELANLRLNAVLDTLSETHIERIRKGFELDVYGSIGAVPVNSISARDILVIMASMLDRGVKESARKTFYSISKTLKWGVSNINPDTKLMYCERNVCSDIDVKEVLGSKSTKHYPIITKDKELKALLYSIDEYSGHSSTKLALKMIAHVFVRPINIRYALWNEIDLINKQWVIPEIKMKTKQELIVPLSSQVCSILEDAKMYSPNSELVFPSARSKTQPLSDAAMVGALRRMNYTKDEIVAHSFRGIFSTIANEKSVFDRDVIDLQLAHSIGSSTSRAYNRSERLQERTEMMQWWSDYLDDLKKKAI